VDRKWGIIAVVIRRLLVVGGAGERPAKAKLTSPGFVLPDCSPLWRAFTRLVYKCSAKKAHTALPAVPEIARVHCQCLRLQCGAVRIGVRACVRWCYRTIVYKSTY
jgi:hypothetical protein